ncbi:unnamed protein product, partial [Mesorhabditis belari]|uniref:Uncharacterized protein n=1 Tax=Mesorhabditis belari TaxID=2138241 RepID=A0AAF3EE20_9BILA
MLFALVFIVLLAGVQASTGLSCAQCTTYANQVKAFCGGNLKTLTQACMKNYLMTTCKKNGNSVATCTNAYNQLLPFFTKTVTQSRAGKSISFMCHGIYQCT